jgi:hypothetical protein
MLGDAGGLVSNRLERLERLESESYAAVQSPWSGESSFGMEIVSPYEIIFMNSQPNLRSSANVPCSSSKMAQKLSKTRHESPLAE